MLAIIFLRSVSTYAFAERSHFRFSLWRFNRHPFPRKLNRISSMDRSINLRRIFTDNLRGTVHSFAEIFLLFQRSENTNVAPLILAPKYKNFRETSILGIEEFYFPCLLTLAVRKQFLIRTRIYSDSI